MKLQQSHFVETVTRMVSKVESRSFIDIPYVTNVEIDE